MNGYIQKRNFEWDLKRAWHFLFFSRLEFVIASSKIIEGALSTTHDTSPVECRGHFSPGRHLRVDGRHFYTNFKSS